MPKFRKKPIVIEAEQYKRVGCGTVSWTVPPGIVARWFRRGQWLKTLEGWMRVSEGDWIITGIKGERYPCKPDIFEATYEPVEEEN
ncbi:hypothetical protein LCGC14_3104850 [marine sediment metagenome]|uniref:Phage protein n=1 Tax=marine sediment metagenome TaxID=412755 RepID=A0A0F8YWS1_9ZZZZ